MFFRKWKRLVGESSLSKKKLVAKLTNCVYRRLDETSQEIRLLVVHPGTGMDRVECTFEYCRLLSDLKSYETISYVWGNPTIRKSIHIGGLELDVPASSEMALRRFRYPDKRRTLWIDAVCINQADDIERASQVAMMDKVYGSGSHNLIWLGEGDHATPVALNCIHRIEEEMRAGTEDFSKASEILNSRSARWSITGLSQPLTQVETEALLDFYSNEWFHRLWVLQEAALSNTSSCYLGEWTSNLSPILRAARWLRYKLHHVPIELDPSPGLFNAGIIFDYCDRDFGRLSQGARNLDLLAILWLSKGFQTSDARDHVFAVLGLLRRFSTLNPDLEIPSPDYQKSISETFSNTAVYCIFDRQDLDILADVVPCLDGSRRPGFPSWVPDWARASNSTTDPAYLPIGSFDASGSEALDLQLLRDTSSLRLRVKGFPWHTVVTCSAVFNKSRLDSNLGRSNIANLGLSSIGRCCNFGESPPTDKLKLNMAMVLTGGLNHQRMGWMQSACEEAYKAYDRVVAKRIVPTLEELTVSSTHDERLASEFAQAVYLRGNNRRLFITRSNALGLGPPTMEAGDMVVVLYGCKAPTILRKLLNTNDEYEFVGICYIHGIMDGEAVEEHRAAGREDTMFTLV